MKRKIKTFDLDYYIEFNEHKKEIILNKDYYNGKSTPTKNIKVIIPNKIPLKIKIKLFYKNDKLYEIAY